MKVKVIVLNVYKSIFYPTIRNRGRCFATFLYGGVRPN
jgi:hypothetical protein